MKAYSFKIRKIRWSFTIRRPMPAALIMISLLISAAITIPAFAVPDTLWTRTFGEPNRKGLDYGRSVQETSDGGFVMLGYAKCFEGQESDFSLFRADSEGNEIWRRTFGGSGADYGYCVRETSDGGFALLGSTESFGAGWTDFWLVKTDSDGNELWNKTFGGDARDAGRCIQETSDGGLILLGDTYSHGAGKSDFWLIKTDSGGSEVWSRTYGGGGLDSGYCIQETSDGGFVLLGETGSYGAGNYDFWLIRIDTDGNEVWNRTFGGSNEDCGRSIKETSDGGFVLLGHTFSHGAGKDDFWLIKTDSEGNPEWQSTFGGREDDVGKCVWETSDKGYILLGTKYYSGFGKSDYWLIKTDSDGNGEWSKVFGEGGYDYGYSVLETSDDELVLLGEATTYEGGSIEFRLIKTDSKGNEVWSKTFGERASYSESGRCVQQTSDDGFVLLGYTDFYGAGQEDAWLIKTDSEGNEVWNKTFGRSDEDHGCSVQETSDGGFVLLGDTKPFGSSDFGLTKTDSDGNEEWTRTFGGSGIDNGYSVQETSDGGFILVGDTRSYGAGSSDVWLIKTDSNGNEEWNRTFGGELKDAGQSVLEYSKGGFALLGFTRPPGSSNTDVWLIKTDSSGNEEWNRTFGGSGSDAGRSVQETTDGGFILLGDTSTHGGLFPDFWLIKTDSEGNEEWDRTFDGGDDDYGMSVRETSDGGFILLGTTYSYGPGGPDLWLIKLGPDVGVDDPAGAPRAGGTALHQNYPNPFNPATAITYTLATETTVKVSVHDTAGRLVAILTDGTAPAGTHTIHWDGTNSMGRSVSSGVYICTLAAGDSNPSESRKMILLK